MESCELCKRETTELSGCENCGQMFCDKCQSATHADYCESCTDAAEEALEDE